MKKKLQKAVSVLLLLAIVLVIPPKAYADSSQDFTNSETYLRTSYNNDNYIELSISGNTLTVSGKLLRDGLTSIMVWYREQFPKSIDAASGQVFSVSVSLSHSGSLPVDVYTQTGKGDAYQSYIWNKIYVEKASGGYRIMPSLVLDENLSFARAYVNPDNFRDSSKVPDSVKSLSNQIAGGETNDYSKIFLLHKWVAENIYYDYDAYRGDLNTTFFDSADILANKRSVCEGYANLLRDLILAQGIPCMKATTYSLGASTNGGSYAVKADEATTDKSNHAHVEAWVDEHWVVMDATWDSRNKYENGTYNTDAPSGFYYFDITPEALALDHKYITRANGKLKMQNGAITGADIPATPTAPSVSGFTDVSANDYYADAVKWAVDKKITTGTSDTTFSPDATCTQGQILTFLWRAKGEPVPAGAVSGNEYYARAAQWAAEQGLTDDFSANADCTRAMVVTYLWKLAGSPKASSSGSFTDVPDTLADAVSWAAEQGVTTGTSETMFSPDDTCTRGQIVTFLYRAYNN